MAYSSIPISATELALLAADKPVIIASNALDDYAVGKWDLNGTMAGADETDLNAPVHFTNDRKTYQTYPNAALATWYLVYQLAVDAADIDCLGFMVHNLGSNSATIAIEIADDPYFTSRFLPLWTVAPADDGRLLKFLDDRYSDVLYIRAEITAAAAFIPRLGELWVGRRRQLKHAPNRPWDDVATRANQAAFTSQGGVRTNYVFSRGQRVISANLNPHEDGYRDDLVIANREMLHGTRGFLWVDKPETSPDAFSMMHKAEADFDFPWLGPQEREWMLTADEQGPHYLELE